MISKNKNTILSKNLKNFKQRIKKYKLLHKQNVIIKADEYSTNKI